jgi:hypothetical protein
MATTKKGNRLEPGIWKQPDGQGYLAEINYTDPRTNRRIRERKSIHRIDLAREWRQTRQTDALRGEVRRRKDGPKPMTFSQLADEYLEIWSKVKKKPSSYIRDQTSVKRLRQVFGRRVISDITRRDVERYFAGRSHGNPNCAECESHRENMARRSKCASDSRLRSSLLAREALCCGNPCLKNTHKMENLDYAT